MTPLAIIDRSPPRVEPSSGLEWSDHYWNGEDGAFMSDIAVVIVFVVILLIGVGFSKACSEAKRRGRRHRGEE